jgi:hypothetical protein
VSTPQPRNRQRGVRLRIGQTSIWQTANSVYDLREMACWFVRAGAGGIVRPASWIEVEQVRPIAFRRLLGNDLCLVRPFRL